MNINFKFKYNKELKNHLIHKKIHLEKEKNINYLKNIVFEINKNNDQEDLSQKNDFNIYEDLYTYNNEIYSDLDSDLEEELKSESELIESNSELKTKNDQLEYNNALYEENSNYESDNKSDITSDISIDSSYDYDNYSSENDINPQFSINNANIEYKTLEFENKSKSKKTLTLIACHTDSLLKKNTLINNINYFLENNNYCDDLVIINSTDFENSGIEEIIMNKYNKNIIYNDILNHELCNSYKKNNIDLINFSNEKLIYHWKNIGKTQKRVVSSDKIINIYFVYYDNDKYLCHGKWLNYLLSIGINIDLYNNFILTNDSFIITRSIIDFLVLSNYNLEMYGLLESHELKYHYPDFLRGYNIIGIKKIINYFIDNKIKINDYYDCVNFFEIDSTYIFKTKMCLFKNKNYVNIHFSKNKIKEFLLFRNYPVIKIKYLLTFMNNYNYDHDINIYMKDFDPTEYAAIHSDIKNYNNTDSIYHFKNHGFIENRIYKLNMLLENIPFFLKKYIIKNNLSPIFNFLPEFDLKNKKVALIIHIANYKTFLKIYYKYKYFFKRNDIIIFITIIEKSHKNKIENLIKNAKIYIVENKGMDIGGFLYVLKKILNNKKYKDIKFIYKIHTKTNDEWRNKMIESLFLNYNKIENYCNIFNKPLIFASENYCYKNKCVNRNYINHFFKRNSILEDILKNSFLNYYDEYITELNDKPLDKLNIVEDFYKFYENDLSQINNLIDHWENFGKYEFHRINNPCYIKKFGKLSFFVAGTIFMCNIEYLKIFKNIDLDNEINILEDEYIINDISRKTHAWEYLFGLLIYLMDSNIIAINKKNEFNYLIENHDLDLDIYKNANEKLKNYNDIFLKKHYYNNSNKEEYFTNIFDLLKKQSIINDTTFKSKIAFFLPISKNDYNFNSFLCFINSNLINENFFDIYFGNDLKDTETIYGLSIIKKNIDDIIKELDLKNKINNKYLINYYNGLNLHKSYDKIYIINNKQLESLKLQKNNYKSLEFI
jgi:hypothetical protein